MKIFISGGCKNGKSLYAQKFAKMMWKNNKSLYYLATMIASNQEDDARILRHKEERRGWGFKTIEVGKNIMELVSKCDMSGTFLLDSVTALLANEMFDANGSVKHSAYKKVADDLKAFADATENIVLVSDYIYSDAYFFDKFTTGYRAGLAYIDREMAKICDVVIETCYGILIVYKGKELLGGFCYEHCAGIPNVDGDVFCVSGS